MASSPTAQAVSLLESFRTRNEQMLENLRVNGSRLTEVSRETRDSWSGSFAGWHGRMYFRDFERPTIEEQFSGEWGGLHGIPDGWQERTTEECVAHVDRVIGNAFSAQAFDRAVTAFRKELLDLKEEISLCLSALGSVLPPKAAEYLAAIEAKELGNPRPTYVQQGMPRGLMSRDTEALQQGMVLPTWLYYEAVGFEAVQTADWFDEYAKLLDRLGRAMTLTAPGKPPKGLAALSEGIHPDILSKCAALYDTGAYAEAVEKGFKTVRDRLRKLTGHETGSEAFGKGRLFIKGAAAPHVEQDFNQAAKFLMMAIDQFRNEKSHTSDAAIGDPGRANAYLFMSSLALYLLDHAEVRS